MYRLGAQISGGIVGSVGAFIASSGLPRPDPRRAAASRSSKVIAVISRWLAGAELRPTSPLHGVAVGSRTASQGSCLRRVNQRAVDGRPGGALTRDVRFDLRTRRNAHASHAPAPLASWDRSLVAVDARRAREGAELGRREKNRLRIAPAGRSIGRTVIRWARVAHSAAVAGFCRAGTARPPASFWASAGVQPFPKKTRPRPTQCR